MVVGEQDMAFITKKTSSRWGKTRNLYYLVANYREDNKIKRETLLKMGESKSLIELLEFTEREENELLNSLNRNEKLLDDFINHNKAPKLMSRSPTIVYKNLTWWVENAKNELAECRNKKNLIRSFM
jgi:hypothetical protein